MKKAAAAKKHILVEKPVAVNSEELAEMMAACQENGVLIMDGTMFVHHQRMDSLTTFLRHPLNQQVSRMQVSLGLGEYYSTLVVSCFMWISALDSSGVLPSYSITSLV